jgi:hypothetical protein
MLLTERKCFSIWKGQKSTEACSLISVIKFIAFYPDNKSNLPTKNEKNVEFGKEKRKEKE